MSAFKRLSILLFAGIVFGAPVLMGAPQSGPLPNTRNGEFQDRLLQVYKERATGFNELYQAFLDNLNVGNKEKLGEMIEYPIMVFIDNKKVKIQNAQQFNNRFDRIFTKKFKSSIALRKESLFVLGQGVAIGEGLVWFSWYSKPSPCWKIKAINNGDY